MATPKTGKGIFSEGGHPGRVTGIIPDVREGVECFIITMIPDKAGDLQVGVPPTFERVFKGDDDADMVNLTAIANAIEWDMETMGADLDCSKLKPLTLMIQYVPSAPNPNGGQYPPKNQLKGWAPASATEAHKTRLAALRAARAAVPATPATPKTPKQLLEEKAAQEAAELAAKNATGGAAAATGAAADPASGGKPGKPAKPGANGG